MMRPSACLLSLLLIGHEPAPAIAAVDAAPGRLESVNILRAGTGSSLAVRTSAVAVLVAATSIDTRTVVIELVGIAAQRRDMSVADGAGMISHVAIDASGASTSGTVTRIRVSLAQPYRHRVRMSGRVVYVDFERAAAAGSTLLARRRPSAGTPAGRRAVSPDTAGVRGAASGHTPAPETKPANAPSSEVSLLSRWLAITEPLQHTSEPPSPSMVLGRTWIPLVLKDGSTIFSHGDYSEVDTSLAFFLPFDDADTPRVEAVVVPASAIDLDATARAAESVRAARYALTRGPREFARLSEEVSAALNGLPSEADPLARVHRVEAVRQRLIEWPAAHHGYRARDIQEAVTILDPILQQLRAAAGVKGVELSLAALTETPSPAIAFRQPTLIDLLENAMRFVSVLAPTQRTAVLEATAESLERHRAQLPAVWFATGRRRVAAALESETRIDDAYRKLSARIIDRAMRAARAGQVRAIDSLRAELLEHDEKLGRARQDVVSATMTALRIQFDLAAHEQLRRDRAKIEGPLGSPRR